MKQPTPFENFVYASSFLLMIALAFFTARFVYRAEIVPADFAALTSLLTFALAFPLWCGTASALIARAYPMRPGRYPENQKLTVEFMMWKVYGFLNLFNLNMFVQTDILPFPLRVPIYRAFGTRVGERVTIFGSINDPMLVEIGDDSLIGGGAILSAHGIANGVVELSTIKIGKRVTVGGRAVIGPGVVIGDGSVVAACSLVTTGVVIPPGELWGGIPARKIKSLAETGAPVSIERGRRTTFQFAEK